MRWKGRERSENVEDRRGMSPRMAIGGGGSILAVLFVLVLKLMDAPAPLQQMAGQLAQRQAQQQPADQPTGEGFDDDYREFISVVLRDTENVWTQLFEAEVQGGSYRPPKLVIFSDRTNTGCGMGQAAMGPFYCPADQMIYIDPTFFEDLARRHKAPGDFAQAYVIAHEVAHHVQNLLGLNNRANQARASGDEQMANQESVRLELQADFLAGVWGRHAHEEYGILEDGDLEEAITAANRIGDDTLQLEAMGYKVPERYKHGTSAQRVRWFKRGFNSGKVEDCQQLMTVGYDQL
ncbi:MAG: zinc metallopeptidase [Planctomycetaceae bacterium]|nr:zinc metallopeptidase [Planctomycetaceae bacterium]